ncbi:unnamed protein product [Lymnaea stagnalis]|uniref:Uncharacterized protein n=1 Tax=Lymnaea stagnalis TaxID=6523 RepID=A0AAV2HKB1_LYMST
MADVPSNNSSMELNVYFTEQPVASLEPKWKILIIVACVVASLVMCLLIYVVAKLKGRRNQNETYWKLAHDQPTFGPNFPGPFIPEFTPGSVKSLNSPTRAASPENYKGGGLGGGQWIYKGRQVDCKDLLI